MVESDERIVGPTARPRLAARARLQQDPVSGRWVLLFPEGLLVLTPTAAAVLELCDGRLTCARLVATLTSRYEVTHQQVSSDVADFLNRLRERGLIETATEEGAAG
jgi:pyrroloquinoline quinone biosynthesis protein D